MGRSCRDRLQTVTAVGDVPERQQRMTSLGTVVPNPLLEGILRAGVQGSAGRSGWSALW